MDRTNKIINVLVIILVLNLLVAITKLIFGQLLNSNSLTADGFHSLTDTFSNIIGIIGMKIARKPADKKHPYGYQKYETLAGLTIGFLLFGILLQIIVSAIDRFINPVEIEFSIPAIIAIVLTIFINIFVAVFEYRYGRKLQSEVLISDSIHTKSDIFISIGVLITIILIKLNVPVIIDPIVSLIIAVFIFKSCVEIFKSNIGVLVDKKVVDEEIIKKFLMEADEEVLDVHRVRSRGKLDYIYIDLHIITRPELSVEKAHELSHKLEKLLEDHLGRRVDLNCHIEPFEDPHIELH